MFVLPDGCIFSGIYKLELINKDLNTEYFLSAGHE